MKKEFSEERGRQKTQNSVFREAYKGEDIGNWDGGRTWGWNYEVSQGEGGIGCSSCKPDESRKRRTLALGGR